jgi:hypothetical protein
MRRALAELASCNGGPFTRAQALECGYTGRQIRLLVDTGLWIRLRHGILVDGNQLLASSQSGRALLDIAGAALTLGRPSAGADRSALLAHGLPLMQSTNTVSLIADKSARGGSAKQPILVRAARLPDEHLALSNGVRLTSVARTLTDLLRFLSARDAVVAIDAALNRGLTTLDELVRMAEETGALPVLMQLLPLCDGRSESPLETISRLALLDLGIPRPELQHEVRDASGQLIARVDFWWEESLTVGEADGLTKYETAEDLRREKVRQARLEQLVRHVVRWTLDEISTEPEAVASRLRRAFLSAA